VGRHQLHPQAAPLTHWCRTGAQGGDLGALIEQRNKSCQPFSEEQIWEAFVQVLAATLHMHERRMMHRDIKPSNVFVTRDGTLKLGDFGLSRHFSSKTNNACSSVGTPYYMSPEVIRCVWPLTKQRV